MMSTGEFQLSYREIACMDPRKPTKATRANATNTSLDWGGLVS
jgi:hypothetical protein